MPLGHAGGQGDVVGHPEVGAAARVALPEASVLGGIHTDPHGQVPSRSGPVELDPCQGLVLVLGAGDGA